MPFFLHSPQAAFVYLWAFSLSSSPGRRSSCLWEFPAFLLPVVSSVLSRVPWYKLAQYPKEHGCKRF